jgi:hypothetical protein
MQCAAPATTTARRKFSTASEDVHAPILPPIEGPAGFVVALLGLILSLFALVVTIRNHRRAETVVVHTPLCRRHARWFSWSSLRLSSLCGDSVTLDGVAEGFVRAYDKPKFCGACGVRV